MNELDIKALRIYAERREWNSAQDILKGLLGELEPLIALTIAAPHAQRFLPVFNTYYPEAGWVKDLLLTVISYASAPKDLPIHSVREFNAPGCGNFLLAVFDMAWAVQTEYTVFERYSHITNAVANAILADLQHTYYSQHPDIFQRLQNDPGATAEIHYAFWSNEAVAERDKLLWMQVADDIETRIKQFPRPA